jgi:hypothetical protein
MLAMVVLGVVAAVLVGANRSQPGPAPAPASLGLPPAALAGGLFTAAAGRPGQPQPIDVETVAAGADAPGLLIAAGRANGQPAAWVSADGGGTWTPATGQDPAVLGRPGAQLTSVAAGPDGWLAVGGPAAPAASAHPVVLTSADGRTWSAADGQAAFRPPGLVAEQAAAGAPAGPGTAAPSYVIVGYQLTAGHPVAAAWWSAGLAGWHRAAAPPAAGARMQAVTAVPGGFVAAGQTTAPGQPGAPGTPAAWTSADGGRTWTQRTVPLPAGATRAALTAVAASGRTVVAMGTATTARGRTVPFAATSTDNGATWTTATLPEPGNTGDATITALTAERTGFFAAGTLVGAGNARHVVVWTSARGSAWTAAATSGPALAGPGRQAITGLTAAGVTLTGVGFTAPPGGPQQPVFWQLPVR